MKNETNPNHDQNRTGPSGGNILKYRTEKQRKQKQQPAYDCAQSCLGPRLDGGGGLRRYENGRRTQEPAHNSEQTAEQKDPATCDIIS